MWDLTGRTAVAASATLHCLTGCAVGAVLGLLVGTDAELSNAATIGLAVGLAFLFGGLLVSVAAQLDDTRAPPQHADVTTLTS
jgi:hypothetical protein